MDPDENLREQLRLTGKLMGLVDDINEDGVYELDTDDIAALCECVESLDKWLSKGGILPSRWQHPRRAA